MKHASKYTLSFILFLIGIFCFWKIYFLQKELTSYKYDYAIVSNVKYGLFNPEIWKVKISEAIYEKIDSFDFTESDKELVEIEINKVLNLLVDQINIYIEEKKKTGNIFQQIGTEFVMGLVYDEPAIRTQIPQYSQHIIRQLESDETKEKIQDYLKDELDKFLVSIRPTTSLISP